MLGDDSDEDQKEKDEHRNENSRSTDFTCSWGLGKLQYIAGRLLTLTYASSSTTETCAVLVHGACFCLLFSLQ